MTSLPIVDLSPLSGGESERKRTAQALCEALHHIGFLYISGHGVPERLGRELMEVSRRFFAEPPEFKNTIAMARAGKAWRGFFPLGAELTSGRPDQKEGLYFGAEHGPEHPGVAAGYPLHGPNQWPAGERYAAFRPLVLEYLGEMIRLGHRMMEAVAHGLGLDTDYFRRRFTAEPTTLFRIFNYPRHVWAESQDEWGVREHTDMGFLTILLQDDQGGLEVRESGGSWIEAPPVDGTFVVNIGDMLEVWTHGIFRATGHRVRNRGHRDRLSLPFFFDPAWNSPLEPISLERIAEPWRNRVRSPDPRRWDGRNLAELASRLTYGEFVWSKVKDVFPQYA